MTDLAGYAYPGSSDLLFAGTIPILGVFGEGAIQRVYNRDVNGFLTVSKIRRLSKGSDKSNR